MEFTYEDLCHYQMFCEEIKNQELPGNLILKISKLKFEIDELVLQYNILLRKLFEQYGVKQGDSYLIPAENSEEYQAEVTKILSQKTPLKNELFREEDIKIFDKLTLSSFLLLKNFIIDFEK